MASISKKITILDFVAVLTIPLISTIGYLNISSQNRLIDGQDEIRKELSSTNTFLQVNTTQISNIKAELSEVKITQKKFSEDVLIRVNGISKRVYKLEGAR